MSLSLKFGILDSKMSAVSFMTMKKRTEGVILCFFIELQVTKSLATKSRY